MTTVLHSLQIFEQATNSNYKKHFI